MKRTNKNNTTWQDFDIEEFLNHYGIDYKTSGKNIGRSWIGLEECPFCGITGNHAALHTQSSGFHCWGCGTKTNAPGYVKEVLKIPFGKAVDIIKKFWNSELEFTIRETGEEVIFPNGLSPVNNIGKNYLRNRGFNPEYIIKKYNLQQLNAGSFLNHAGIRSDFQYRIFIPIKMYREVVSFSARDYTGKRDPKYQHPFLEACVIPPSSCIYNIDTVKDKALILEGFADCWRMGDESVSMQGIQATKEQIRYLYELNLRKAVIMYDSNKTEEAKKLAYSLAGVIPEVKVVNLSSGDPGDLTEEEAIKIKMEVLK